MMKLYHGSNVIIEKIDLSKSRPFKDFGRAFYLSADEQQAWDKVGEQVALFKGGYINKDRFLQKLKLMRGITFQYAFCTESAILNLRKL